jgi:hypothetical protein
MKTLAISPALAVAACMLAATAAPAAAAGGNGKAPPGYTIVQSSMFTAPSGAQTIGSVSCPTGTVVWGGGGLIEGSDLRLNLNSSLPNLDGGGWTVDVNNTADSFGLFFVEAVCARAPRKYQILESADVTVGAGSQANASQSCPAGTVVLGGGSLSDSGSPAVNINSTLPIASINGWQAEQNDDASFDTTFHAFAICGKAPTGYAILGGPIVLNPPLSQTNAVAACPTGRPLSGGALSNVGSPVVNLNSSQVGGGGWTAYENNASLIGGATLEAFVICT